MALRKMLLGWRHRHSKSEGAPIRRSTRLPITIPIAVSGKDGDDRTFKENSRTVVINKHGAKIAMLHQVAVGAEVLIENRALGRAAKANVVWVASKPAPQKPSEIAIELVEPDNIWGIESPPTDWRGGAPIGSLAQRLECIAGRERLKVTEAAAPPEVEATASEPALAPAVADPGVAIPPQAAEAVEPPIVDPATLELPGVPLAPIDGFVWTATTRFAKAAEGTAELRSKPTDHPGFKMQVSLQDTPNPLEKTLVHSLEQKLGTLTDRLQASRTEVEALLTEFQELQQRFHSEIEEAQRNVQEASWKALNSALEELNNRVQKDLETASSNFAEQTRRRLQDELCAAVEAFGREAGARLATLSEGCLSKSIAEPRAAETQSATEQTKEQIGQVIQTAIAEATEKLKGMADEMAPSLQAAVEKGLEKSADQLVSRLAQSVQEQAQTACRSAEQSCQHNLQKMQEQIQEEIIRAGVSARQFCEREVERANQAVGDRIAANLGEAVDSVNLAAKEAAGKLQTVHQKEGADQLQADQLQKIAEDLLKSSAQRLGKQAEDTLERWSEKLRSSGKGLVDETEKQIAEKARATLESFSQEAVATVEQSAGQLASRLFQWVQEQAETACGSAEQSCQQNLQKMREQIQEEIVSAGLKTQQFCEREVERANQAAGERIAQNANAAVDSVNLAAEEAVAKLQTAHQNIETSSKANAAGYQQQLAELSTSALEGLQCKSDALLDGFQGHLQNTVRGFQEKGAKEVSDQLQKIAEDLLKSSGQRLGKQAEDTLERWSEKLRSSGKGLIDQTEKQIAEKARETLESLSQEAVATVEKYRSQLGQALQEAVEAFRKQADGLSKPAHENLRRDSQVLVDDLHVRLLQVARLLESKSMDAIHAEPHKFEASPREAQAPSHVQELLDKVQLLALLAGGVESERVARSVEQRGIDFEPTEGYLQTLRAAGADEDLLKAVRAAKQVKAPGAEPTTRTKEAVIEHLGRGAELRQKKSYLQAEQEFRAALDLEPGNSVVHFALGNALTQQKKGDGAISEYREAVRLQPDYVEAHYNLGCALYQKHDLDGAIAEYREVVRLEPGFAQAHNNLGCALYEKHDLDGAIAEVRKAVHLNPGNAQAHKNLALALEQKGERQAALEQYRLACELAPNIALRAKYESLLRELKR